MTESLIIQRCREGDREAQRALYDLTSGRIYRLLLRMSRNEQDAFDLAQDTYVRVFERIHQFNGSSSITTWVYRIATNEALQFLRRRKRRDSSHQRHEGWPGPTSEPDADARLDLEAALDRLPEMERALITLKYFEGLDYAEMAQILDRPAGTIASGLNRARHLLRQLLASEPELDEPSTSTVAKPLPGGMGVHRASGETG